MAAVMVSTAAVAQDKDSNKPSVGNNRKQEMVKHRTDKMVEDYQLNTPVRDKSYQNSISCLVSSI